MEQLTVGPAIEQAYGEIAPIEQPDFATIYGDQLITMFGLTKPVGDMIKLCPKDLSELSTDQINAYLVPMLNESGNEIDPAHKTVFDDHLKRQTLEPNYKLAPAADKAEPLAKTQEPEQVVAALITPSQTKILPELLKADAAINVVATQLPLIEKMPTATMPAKVAIEAIIEQTTFLQTGTPEAETIITPAPVRPVQTVKLNHVRPVLAAPVVPKRVEAARATLIDMPIPDKPAIITTETAPSLEISLPTEPPTLEAVPFEATAEVTPTKPATAETTIAETENYQSLMVAIPALETILPAQPPAVLNLSELLTNTAPFESEELVDQPSETLPLLIGIHDMVLQQADAAEAGEVPPSIQLYAEVAQITNLIAEQAMPDIEALPEEAQIAIIERLVVASTALLEALGLPADEITVQRFIFTILQEERLGLVAERIFNQPDLTRDGTHEAKSEDWFARFGRFLLRLEQGHQSYIGRLALTASPARV